MWTLRKPDLRKAKKDIDVVLAHCKKLGAGDKPLLEQLYDDYDNGGGVATPLQLLPLDGKKDIIRGQYAKTTGKQPGKRANNHLVYIRTELNKNVVKCPYCSVNAPQQLDHYMDKSHYGQLAVCRLNLVPLCGTCNNKKGEKPYTDFVHPYYQRFPAADFLVADCKIVKNRVVAKFLIDRVALGDNALADKIEKQIVHISLRQRLQKATTEFLSQTFLSFCGSTDAELKSFLNQHLLNTSALYGRNDWRTALLRGLAVCPQFDVNVVKNMVSKPINGGGA